MGHEMLTQTFTKTIGEKTNHDNNNKKKIR